VGHNNLRYHNPTGDNKVDLSGDDISVVLFSSYLPYLCFFFVLVCAWKMYTVGFSFFFSLGLKLALLGYGVCALGQNICAQIFVL
jgi:hypothetical protein